MILYHATFSCHVPNILKHGLLLPNGKSNFGMYVGEYIFFATNPSQAESFCECADDGYVPDEVYNSGITVLKVNIPDNVFLLEDINMHDKETMTYMIETPIPPEYIEIYKKG